MITKSLKYIAFCSVFCGIAAVTTSCSDWDDHYEASEAQGSNLTLWEQLKQEPQLSDFCQVLEQTKVFRMHRKTSVSYADLLASGGQSFTVVAPVNGTFNRDSLLNLVQTNQGDSVVEKFFVHNHLSRLSCSLTEKEQQMLLLNQKHVMMQGTTIQGVSIIKPNRHAKNGVLHVASTSLPYDYNLYEALCDIPEMSGIGSILRQYEEDYFDADNSVSSGIVEGVPVYVDSVVIERNKMLERIGLLNVEDSTYWVVAPTTEGWNRAWEQTVNYFNYDKKVNKRDSIQQYWTCRALLDDAIFNMTDQKSPEDSLVSVPYLSWLRSYKIGKPTFHVFFHPFQPGGILYGAQTVRCSNGVLYQVNEWPFTPEQTFFKELWTEAENLTLITDIKKNEKGNNMCNTISQRVVADSISEDSYLRIIPLTSTTNWELSFRVNNTLSAEYDVCAIILPKSVKEIDNPNLRPCKFKATINYVDEEGVSQTFKCNNDKTFQNDPLRVDTVVLAEAFRFPSCNYDQDDIKVSVRLICNILPKESSKYAREMYLDCIYLRPRRTTNE